MHGVWLSSRRLLLWYSLEKYVLIESGRRQRVHASSSTSLNLNSSFLVIIIPCSILNESCLNLLSFVDFYINEIFSPIFEIIREDTKSKAQNLIFFIPTLLVESRIIKYFK